MSRAPDARFDAIVVGAGVGGAAVAWFLVQRGLRVCVVEGEAAPARHASGRSAEAMVELAEDPVIDRLASDARGFLRQPPAGFAPLVRPTGALHLVDADELAGLGARAADLGARGIAMELLTVDGARRHCPALGDTGAAGAAWLPNSGRIAVSALVAGYLAPATVRTGTRLCEVVRDGERVVGAVIEDAAGVTRLAADWLVDAAGPWAAEVAALAEASAIELSPLRRTVISFDAPAGLEVAGWPLTTFDARGIYLAPEGAGLLASPMDETASPPCDAAPTDEAIALCLERLAWFAPELVPAVPRATRAGLRTFAVDRRPVVGRDPARPGLAWMAGLGGFGIETSPALGRIAAELIVDGECWWPDVAALVPGRFG